MFRVSMLDPRGNIVIDEHLDGLGLLPNTVKVIPLERYNRLGSYTLVFETDNRYYRGITTNKQGDGIAVLLKKDMNRDQDTSIQRFEQRVAVKFNGEVYHTEFPQNVLRLLWLDRSGRAGLIEISLISQHGNFFLGIQRTYTFRVTRDEQGEIRCTRFEKDWPQLVEVIKSLVVSVDALPQFDEEPEQTPPYEDLNENQARVAWWSVKEGYGMTILFDGTMARIHWSNSRDEFPVYYNEGEVIQFSEISEPINTKGRETKFQQEIKGFSTDLQPAVV